MALIFENLVIDRVLDGVFRNADAQVLGGLNQVQNLTINTTSESKDKTDATGVLIKRFFTSKQVELSAENAIFSLSLMGLQTGNGKNTASSTNKITLPMIKKYAKSASPIVLPKTPVEGTLSVTGLTSDGLPDITLVYEENTQAGPGKYSYATATNTLTLPTDATDYVQIMFKYESENGVSVLQSADKFPRECELVLSVLVCDACDKETLRHAYITFPAFQMSPDFELGVATDSPHSFSGIAAVDYCSADKSLFYVQISEDDVEA